MVAPFVIREFNCTFTLYNDIGMISLIKNCMIVKSRHYVNVGGVRLGNGSQY